MAHTHVTLHGTHARHIAYMRRRGLQNRHTEAVVFRACAPWPLDQWGHHKQIQEKFRCGPFYMHILEVIILPMPSLPSSSHCQLQCTVEHYFLHPWNIIRVLFGHALRKRYAVSLMSMARPVVPGLTASVTFPLIAFLIRFSDDCVYLYFFLYWLPLLDF